MLCSSPSGFVGGDKVHVQLTFNGEDYSTDSDSNVFLYYSIQGAFPHSGPSNAFEESILIKGHGFKPNSKVLCSLNRTESYALEITENVIRCPMTWQGKDPDAIGAVKFGMSMDGSWTDFGTFYFYT